MNHDCRMTRKNFLVTCGTMAAGTMLGQRPAAIAFASDGTPPIRLKSWDVVEFPARKETFRCFVKITGDNGAVGYCRALGNARDISGAEQAVAGANLLDREKLYDLMVSEEVPSSQLKIPDIACWDLHARMLDKPLLE